MRRARVAAAPRRFWFDARFGIGVALIIGSVAGVVGLVTSVDRSSEVWAARQSLVPGDLVDADDLVLRKVRLGESGALYLARDTLPADGLVMTQAVAAGELVPGSAVGAAEGVSVASLIVPVAGRLPRSVGAGSVVDVWSAQEQTAGTFGPPAVLVDSATVVRIVEDDGLIVDGAEVGVEVLVPRNDIAPVLEAIANHSSMSLVPVSIPRAD